MRRYILLHKGRGLPPKEDVDQIANTPGIRILEEVTPRLLLVEAPEAQLDHLIRRLSGWVMSEEKTARLA